MVIKFRANENKNSLVLFDERNLWGCCYLSLRNSRINEINADYLVNLIFIDISKTNLNPDFTRCMKLVDVYVD